MISCNMRKLRYINKIPIPIPITVSFEINGWNPAVDFFGASMRLLNFFFRALIGCTAIAVVVTEVIFNVLV